MMINILFVCMGNTCRSVLCEYISRKIIAEKKLSEKILIKSCGICATGQNPASDNTVTLIEKFDPEITNHRSSQITLEKINSASYIFALDQLIFNYLKQNCDEATHKKISILTPTGISDPYGLPLSAYEECADHITKCLEKIFDEIIKNEKL